MCFLSILNVIFCTKSVHKTIIILKSLLFRKVIKKIFHQIKRSFALFHNSCRNFFELFVFRSNVCSEIIIHRLFSMSITRLRSLILHSHLCILEFIFICLYAYVLNVRIKCFSGSKTQRKGRESEDGSKHSD